MNLASRVVAARAIRLAAVLSCVATLASCSSSPTLSVTPVSPASSTSPALSVSEIPPLAPAPTLTPPATAAPACPVSTLTVKQGRTWGYADGAYEVIDFTNTSGAACTLYGYPGVSLLTGPPYAQLGRAAARDSTVPVKLVTLAPGATASAVLQILDALNYSTSKCSAVKATYLRVYPPNQGAPAYLASTSYGCAKSAQTLFISAVQAGGE